MIGRTDSEKSEVVSDIECSPSSAARLHSERRLLAACGSSDDSTNALASEGSSDSTDSGSSGSADIGSRDDTVSPDDSEALVDAAEDALGDRVDNEGDSATVTFGGETWQLGMYPENPAGIGVTDFSLTGTMASGTAVFFEQESHCQFTAALVDELELADGTFQVTCAGG